MKKTDRTKSNILFSGTNSLFLKCFLAIIIISASSCKKKNDPAPVADAETSSIFYKTYLADSVNFTADSLFFDVNNDGKNDIKVTMQHKSVGGMMNYSGSISAVNNNMNFCYMITEPNWAMLAPNDVINSATSLDWMPVASYSGSTSFVAGSNSWARGIFTNYFGFKITLNSGNYYGWFRFKWQTITETGMNLASETPIKVGQKE